MRGAIRIIAFINGIGIRQRDSKTTEREWVWFKGTIIWGPAISPFAQLENGKHTTGHGVDVDG